ncbi:MAG: DUF5691 domain-containing protein, partial [Rhodocyclaceae bacterium]
MTHLRSLSTQALIGVERRPPEFPPVEGELGAVLAHVAHSDATPEARLLRYAGVLTVAEQAGFQPPSPPTTPDASAAETTRTIDDAAIVSVLDQVLADGPPALRAELFERLALARCHLPPRLLPRALTLADRDASLRTACARAMGQRGHWLIKLNPAWQTVLGTADAPPDASAWDTGTQDARAGYLSAVRRLCDKYEVHWIA